MESRGQTNAPKEHTHCSGFKGTETTKIQNRHKYYKQPQHGMGEFSKDC